VRFSPHRALESMTNIVARHVPIVAAPLRASPRVAWRFIG